MPDYDLTLPLEEKRELAREWMKQEGIALDKTKWKGPNLPVPNLAGRQPVLQGFDVGIKGQVLSLLRMLAA